MSQVDTRQLGRDSLFLLAQLRFEGQSETYRVKVRNLSSGGMMAEGALRVTQGASVQVELRNIGWVPGNVAWTADGRFGIAFAEEIDPKLARAPVSGAGDPASQRYARPPVTTPATGFANFRKI
jgi:hypothetical protein